MGLRYLITMAVLFIKSKLGQKELPKEDYKTLMAAMKKALPLYATPSHQLLQQFKTMHKSDKLEISNVHYLGSEGGISCSVNHDNSIFVISVTHLNFANDQPLAAEINAYKTNRVKQIKMQGVNMGGTNNIGRNALCSCGSGKKYKRCCGK